MEEILARILEKVVIIDSSLDAEDELLKLIAQDVVDRALTYTNRTQLIEDYEDALEIYADLEEYPDDVLGADGSIDGISCPIPKQLELTLANAIVRVWKNTSSLKNDEMAVKSVNDQGQTVSFSEQLTSYLASSTETELFSGSIAMLDKFRIPTIVENI